MDIKINEIDIVLFLKETFNCKELSISDSGDAERKVTLNLSYDLKLTDLTTIDDRYPKNLFDEIKAFAQELAKKLPNPYEDEVSELKTKNAILEQRFKELECHKDSLKDQINDLKNYNSHLEGQLKELRIQLHSYHQSIFIKNDEH